MENDRKDCIKTAQSLDQLWDQCKEFNPSSPMGSEHKPCYKVSKSMLNRVVQLPRHLLSMALLEMLPTLDGAGPEWACLMPRGQQCKVLSPLCGLYLMALWRKGSLMGSGKMEKSITGIQSWKDSKTNWGWFRAGVESTGA